MANEIIWNDASPGDTDDVQEGAQRIREAKKAIKERFNRDHFIAGADDPAAMASTNDTGYHRRVTIQEQPNDYNPATRVATISGGTHDHSEIYVRDTDAGGADQELMVETSVGNKTIVSTTQTQTLTNKTLTAPVLTNPAISGGSGAIDGVAVGTTTPAAGVFTTLESTSHLTVGNEVPQAGAMSHSSSLTDRINLKAETNGDTKTYAGAGKMYAGITGEIKMFSSPTAPPGWLNCDGSEYLISLYPELYAIILLSYTDTTAEPGAFGTSGNARSADTKFRVPRFAGRIPIGLGTGKATGASAGNLSDDALIAQHLGYYTSEEVTTLSEAQSGVKQHTHDAYITEASHMHELKGSTETTGDAGRYADIRDMDLADLISANGNPIQGAVTGVKVTRIADATEPTDINRTGGLYDHSTTNYGAADAHTNMQPSLCVNFIIKY